MHDIAIYGAGGFGREIACLIKLINENKPTWNLIGFFDDNASLVGTKNEYGPILGTISELNSWTKPLDIAIAIGDPHNVRCIVENIKNPLVSFPNIFSPHATFLDKQSVTFGRGNIVCSNCFFSCNVQVGDFNIFNIYTTVGHDATFGNYNSLMPAVRISGEVKVGDENFFGVDAVVLQQIKIGNHVKIGANSLIIRKTKDGNTYVCPPTEIL